MGAALAGPPASAWAQATPAPSWVAAWGMPTDAWGPTYAPRHPELHAQTVRMVLRLGFGGSEARIKISNAQGTAPLTITDAHIANSSGGMITSADVPLTWNGSPSVTIPVGATATSDGAALTTPALGQVAVSFYVPDDVASVTGDTTDTYATTQLAYGDRAADPSNGDFAASFGGGFLLTGVDVYGPNDGLVVALGDSITAGTNLLALTEGQLGLAVNQGWPYWLANRLAALAADGGPRLSVIDMGIGSNEVTHDDTPAVADLTGGSSALARLRTDVLDQTGFHTLLMMEGINDIGAEQVPAPTLEAAYATIDGEVRAAGGTMYLSPLTPSGDQARSPIYGRNYWSAAGEAERAAVNGWIESSPMFSAGFDFPPVVENPSDTNELAPGYDSGDHLHPDTAGYQAMAASVELALLAPATPTPPGTPAHHHRRRRQRRRRRHRRHADARRGGAG